MKETDAKPPAPWFVYILRCADRTLYTGVTTDAEKRLSDHNSGRGARYTRARLPVCLVYLEPAEDRSAALRRESEIKRMRAADKRRLVKAGGGA
ncbi:MAG TPA: GIY-YIG nuclease family protein [Candidatus Krumholzibacteria bacterium]|nr:GIY-YIG nuclease family protein [Candidatus Krumholzibacteria bacterium]